MEDIYYRKKESGSISGLEISIKGLERNVFYKIIINTNITKMDIFIDYKEVRYGRWLVIKEKEKLKIMQEWI